MLSFEMSEEQKMMKETAAALINNRVAEIAHDMDENKNIPDELVQKAWDLGVTLSAVPEEYGGYGMDYSPVMNSIFLEELAGGDMAFAIAAALPSLFIYPLLEMGTEEQKKKYLPLYCTEKYTPCTLAIQEPHFNSDISILKSTAEKKGESYILNGEKCFVPMAAESGHMLVAASVDGKAQLFIVSRDNPGLKIGEVEKNLGLYSLKTYTIMLEECEVPEVDMLGGPEGCDYRRIVQKSRTGLAAVGTGVSRASYEYTKDYAREREQFGQPIAARQSVAFMIAEMAYEVDAMRLLTWKSASVLEAGKDAVRESYHARIYAGEMAMKVTDFGVQVLGGHGYIRDHPVERYYRNGRGIAILEGMVMV